MKYPAALILALAASSSAMAVAPNAAISNGGFEVTSIHNGSYAYAADAASLGLGVPTVAQGTQPATGWSFSGLAGVSANAKAWSSSISAAHGHAYAFLQTYNNFSGTFSQDLTLSAAVPGLDISFASVQRLANAASAQTVKVTFSNAAGIIASQTYTPGTQWSLFDLTVGTLNAGAYKLTFSAAGALGKDRTAFIDDVSMKTVASVPEVDTVLLSLMGAAVALGARTRRRAAQLRR